MFGMMIDSGPKFAAVPSPTPLPDLKVKVTDLDFLCSSFTLKFLGPHPMMYWLKFKMLIGTGPKLYAVPSPPL